MYTLLEPFERTIYTLIESLSLIRVVHFLHGQLCPLGNTISEGEHYQMFCTDLHFNRIYISN